jgi:hypothetical protein
MYNVDGDFLVQEIFQNKLKQAGIDFYFDKVSIMPTLDCIIGNKESEYEVNDEGSSLWVLEEHYLIAFALLNYEELLDINFYDIDEMTVQDCLDWFEMHKNNELFINYK